MISHSESHQSNFVTGQLDGTAVLRQLLTRLWPIFVTSWVVFVVINPVATLLKVSNSPLETLLSLAWAMAFIAAYLRLVLYQPFSLKVTDVERHIRIALLLVLTALVLYIDLTLPSGYFWLFIYVNVAAGALLPARGAAWFIIAITLLAIAVEVPRSEWAQAMAVPGIAIWGLSTMMLRRLVFTVEELRQAREELARLAVAEERLRFGRDLHDLLGHSLSVIALKSELAGRLARARAETAEEEIRDIERIARRSLREVRQAVTGYRQPTLSEELASARDTLAVAGIRARFDVTTGTFPCAIVGVLAWVIREAVTNVVRHSFARHCKIRIDCSDDIVRVLVTDDGVGLAGSASTGSGLAGIAERIAACGGTMSTTSGPEGGFSLHIEVPLRHEVSRTSMAGAAFDEVRTA